MNFIARSFASAPSLPRGFRGLFARSTRIAPNVPPGQRIYAVGDVHGRLDLLDQLLAKIEADIHEYPVNEPIVVLLGDLIDRGPDSRAVVERAMTPASWGTIIALKGNHESAMLRALAGDSKMLALWLSNGGISTLRSWGIPASLIWEGPAEKVISAANDAMDGSILNWLENRPSSVKFGSYYFVHAGIQPGVKLDKQDESDKLWISREFLESKISHGAMIVHGHSTTDEIDEQHNRIGIDTGAYSTGKLTALILEGFDRRSLQTAL